MQAVTVAEATAEKRSMKTEDAYLAYMTLGSYEKAGKALGISASTLHARLKSMSTEERERAWRKARGVLGDRLIELIFQALGALPGKVDDANMRDLVGLVKVFMEKVLLIQGEATSRSETSHLEDVFGRALKELDGQKERKSRDAIDEMVPATMSAD